MSNRWIRLIEYDWVEYASAGNEAHFLEYKKYKECDVDAVI